MPWNDSISFCSGRHYLLDVYFSVKREKSGNSRRPSAAAWLYRSSAEVSLLPCVCLTSSLVDIHSPSSGQGWHQSCNGCRLPNLHPWSELCVQPTCTVTHQPFSSQGNCPQRMSFFCLSCSGLYTQVIFLCHRLFKAHNPPYIKSVFFFLTQDRTYRVYTRDEAAVSK